MVYLEKVVDYISRLRSRYGKNLTQSNDELAQLYVSENPKELQGRELLSSVKQFLSKMNRGEALKGVSSLSDIDLLDMIKGTVRKYRYRFCPHCRDDDDDLAMDIYLHFKQKGFLERFNPAVCEIHYYIWMGCRNYMIDQERRSKSINYVSFDEEFSTPDKEILLIDEEMTQLVLRSQLIYDLVDLLQMEEAWGEVRVTPLGDMQLSLWAIVKFYLEGYKPTEIGKIFNISRLRVVDLYNEAVDLLREYVRGREMVLV